MRNFIIAALLLCSTLFYAQLQTLTDNFEGNGNILSWYGSDCWMDNQFANPYPSGINSSATVLNMPIRVGYMAMLVLTE
jgi:hypothetical protein